MPREAPKAFLDEGQPAIARGVLGQVAGEQRPEGAHPEEHHQAEQQVHVVLVAAAASEAAGTVRNPYQHCDGARRAPRASSKIGSWRKRRRCAGVWSANVSIRTGGPCGSAFASSTSGPARRVTLAFSLPPGAYATTVLGELFAFDRFCRAS